MDKPLVKIDDLHEAIRNGTLTVGDWDACMMGVLAGHSVSQCVTNGWPRWLVNLNTQLFDVDANEYKYNRSQFALDIAEAVIARKTPITEDIAREHAARCLDRCIGYIGDGDTDCQTQCRDVVASTAKTLRSGRWLDGAEAAEAAEAARAAELHTQRLDLVELLRGESKQ